MRKLKEIESHRLFLAADVMNERNERDFVLFIYTPRRRGALFQKFARPVAGQLSTVE